MPYKDPEKGKWYSRNYYIRNKERMATSNRRWRQQNRKENLAYKYRWREEHREECLASKRRWWKKHNEERHAYAHRWRECNPEKTNTRHARYHARKRNLPDTLSPEQAEHLLVVGRAMYPGEKLHLDHIVPLSRGGGTTRANMHAIPARLNQSKSNALPEKIYQQLTLDDP